MRFLVAVTWLSPLLVLGGCGVDDACARIDGSCVALLVEGSGLAPDQIAVRGSGGFSVDGASPRPAGAPFALPVTVAVVPPPGFSGAFTLDVRGLAGGATIGRGSVGGSLTAGQHVELRVTLSASDGGTSDDAAVDGALADMASRPDGALDASSIDALDDGSTDGAPADFASTDSGAADLAGSDGAPLDLLRVDLPPLDLAPPLDLTIVDSAMPDLVPLRASTWKGVSVGVSANLHGVWTDTPGGQVFVVGDGGLILHSAGGAFTSEASGTTNSLTSVYGPGGPSRVWAVGRGGVVLHRGNGSSGAWSPAGPAGIATYDVMGVWEPAAGDVWIAGTPSGFFQHTINDGVSWSDRKGGVDNRAVTALGLHGYAVGDDGTNAYVTVAVENGGETTTTIPGLTHVDGAWAETESTLLIAGANGAVMISRDAGATFTPSVTGVTTQLHSIWGSGPNDIYVVGDGGLVLHSSDGAMTWQPVPVPTTADLTCVRGTGPLDVWITGTSGTLLHGT